MDQHCTKWKITESFNFAFELEPEFRLDVLVRDCLVGRSPRMLNTRAQAKCQFRETPCPKLPAESPRGLSTSNNPAPLRFSQNLSRSAGYLLNAAMEQFDYGRESPP